MDTGKQIRIIKRSERRDSQGAASKEGRRGSQHFRREGAAGGGRGRRRMGSRMAGRGVESLLRTTA